MTQSYLLEQLPNSHIYSTLEWTGKLPNNSYYKGCFSSGKIMVCISVWADKAILISSNFDDGYKITDGNQCSLKHGYYLNNQKKYQEHQE